ncbi:MAG: family 31 glucosidase [Lachnospiraceae bacterium]|nr:family 31 glucosidase [Lachnospiraceae bacterium]
MKTIYIENGRVFFKRREEILEICGWGRGLRVRATANPDFAEENWALEEDLKVPVQITEKTQENGSHLVEIRNGSITAQLNDYGKLTFYDAQGKLLLKEYYRSWDYGGTGYNKEGWNDLDQIVQMRVPAREYHVRNGSQYQATLRFEADEEERLYGMGQFQMPYLNLKGCQLDLEPRNTQIPVPFCISSKGYGLLWNNPAIGKAVFGRNKTEFTAQSTKQIDYWITAGESPAKILEAYTEVTGRVQEMPEYGLGFWQCKLRYQNQEEILEVARKYKAAGLPLKVIVIDFFHWPHQGDWKFDPEYWPDPKAMIEELHAMGIKVMVSVWPTVEDNSENREYMQEHDLLLRSNRGGNYAMGNTRVIDPTNPETRKFVWETCKKNYLDLGVDCFWLDEAEPEFTDPDFDIYRMYEGDYASCAGRFAVGYARGFYEGQKEAGVEKPLSLVRCAWAGAQKYGALIWSGDVPSTFTYLKNQTRAGINMGLAGIAWWTADIGGFHGGNVEDPHFKELLIRWFQFGTFCPVMRLHGDRDPHKAPLGSTGGGMVPSGADNEIWSYGPEAEKILTKYVRIRENLKAYIAEQMEEARKCGAPVIRPLFYQFPEDPVCWKKEDSYLFGPDLLVTPITEEGVRETTVYLPAGKTWKNVWTGEEFRGGQEIRAEAPLEDLPLFTAENERLFTAIREV